MADIRWVSGADACRVGWGRVYPAFVDHFAARELTLPRHVQREFADYLKCGRLKHGSPRARRMDCHAEWLVAFSCK